MPTNVFSFFNLNNNSSKLQNCDKFTMEDQTSVSNMFSLRLTFFHFMT